MSVLEFGIIEILTQVINMMFNSYIILMDEYHRNDSNCNDEVQVIIALVIWGI